MRSIHIAGGDERQVYLSEMLKEKGYSVSLQGFEGLGIESEIKKADVTFLPVPYKVSDGSLKAPFSNYKITLSEIVSYQKPCFFVLGSCDKYAKELIGDSSYFDILEDEGFQIDNAVLTAEGAICAYQNYKKRSLCGAKCIVVGFGRIGKQLCSMLKAYTSDITATARKETDFALIRAAQLKYWHTDELESIAGDAQVIFNTVPYHVFGQKELLAIKHGTVLVELASAPYGCNTELTKKMGIDVRIESGIPGRYFPKSAAAAMMRAFEKEEKKIWN